MADDAEELCFVAAAAASVVVTSAAVMRDRTARQKRRLWVRPLFQRRIEFGAVNVLMSELRESDTQRYAGFTRMSFDDFDTILSLIRNDITGSSAFRLPIPAEARLAVTLRYLATGIVTRCQIHCKICKACVKADS